MSSALLLENGSYLLQEDGTSHVLLEISSGETGEIESGLLRATSGVLVRGSGAGTLENGFMIDTSGAVLFGTATPYKVENGFLRDANYALVESHASSGVWDSGFLRDTSDWALVTVAAGSATAPLVWNNGFIRDAAGRIVTDT